MDMECAFDYLHLYDGENEGNRSLAQLCSMPSTPVFEASSNYVYLRMTTDGSVVMPGFRLKWYPGKISVTTVVVT